MSESHKSVQQRLEEKQKEARERQLRNLADYEIITADFKDLPQPMPRNFQTHEQLGTLFSSNIAYLFSFNKI